MGNACCSEEPPKNGQCEDVDARARFISLSDEHESRPGSAIGKGEPARHVRKCWNCRKIRIVVHPTPPDEDEDGLPYCCQPDAVSIARGLLDRNLRKMTKGCFVKTGIRPGGGPEVAEKIKYIKETLNPIMELLLKDILIVLPAEPLLFVVIWLRKRKHLKVDAKACARAGIAFDPTKCAGGQGKLTASQEPYNSSDEGEEDDAVRAIYKLYIQYELTPLIEEITHFCVCEMPPDPTQFLLDFAERKLADMDKPGELHRINNS